MRSNLNVRGTRRLLWLVPFVFLLILPNIVSPQSEQAGVTIQRRVPGLGVTISMPPSRELNTSRINYDKLKLTPESIVVREGETIDVLLTSNGIRPNVDSLGLIYDLNPEIDDLTEIFPGTRLKLPQVTGDGNLEKALRRSYRIGLIRDQTAIRDLNTMGADLNLLTNRVTALESSHFNSLADRETVLEALRTSGASIDVIGNTKFAVSKKVLLKAVAESRFMKQTLEAAVSSQQPISGEVLKTVSSIASFLDGLSESIKSGDSGQVRTIIRTLNSAGQDEKSLRIWYRLDRQGSSSEDCDEVSSPTRETIVRGDYIFWGTRGTDSKQRDTDEVRREIRIATKDDPIELRVRP